MHLITRISGHKWIQEILPFFIFLSNGSVHLFSHPSVFRARLFHLFLSIPYISQFICSPCIFNNSSIIRSCLEARNFSVYFNFHSLYKTWKHQSYRISGSEYYEWLFGPANYSRLLRSGPHTLSSYFLSAYNCVDQMIRCLLALPEYGWLVLRQWNQN